MRRTIAFISVLSVLGTYAQDTAWAKNYATELVNPFIGTGGHGHTFPGACVPFGMVQLSPDTRTDPDEWDGCGGYHFSDSLIYGFSHTHLSGTGVADLCDVLLMPVTGEQSASWLRMGYRQLFDHSEEQAHAGYYKVRLRGAPAVDYTSLSSRPVAPLDRRDPIDVELTATARVGVHRYAFPKDQNASVILDLLHRDKVLRSEIQLVSPTEVVGSRESSSWAKDQHLFFCIRFSSPVIDRTGTDLRLNSQTAFNFGKLAAPLIVKVGISAVSIEGARKNLEAEVPGWDFDAVRKQTEEAWDKSLGRIQVKGGTHQQKRIFYTALYHSLLVPYIFNDVDRQYRGNDGQVHIADHDVYTVFSLWDTFRAEHPLLTILEPDRTVDFIKTFLDIYQQTGKLPVWELWGNETNCMIGYHSVSVIADAYMKGIRGFDADLALKAMVVSASADDPGSIAYRTKGYISSEDCAESVSKTLEYAYDDGCIAKFKSSIERHGQLDTGLTFWTRSSSYENLYDPGAGFFKARRNGGFIPGFDPLEVNFNFTEANAWQYSLFAPQDIKNLIALHGGRAGLEHHLDHLFNATSATSGREQADITGLIGQYAQGNEPSHNMAYLYDRVGRPNKTRELVKRIMQEMYRDTPDGLIGNEDCGQMSAWYVMSALGLYQISPGIDSRYDLGYPLFDEATIHLSGGKSWTMALLPTGAIDPALPKDTSAFTSFLPSGIDHHELVQGGTWRFNEDRSPRRRYKLAGPSLILDGAYVAGRGTWQGAPLIVAPATCFTDHMEVNVQGRGTCSVKDVDGVHNCPMNAPFTIVNTSTVEVDWQDHYAPVTAHFTKIDGTRTIKLESTYTNQYAAGGDQALVDGLRGGKDFRTGEWQGYRGEDVLATVDLGSVKKLKRAGLSALQDQGSWIWYPSEVTFAWSTNGHAWSSTTVNNTIDRKADGGQTQEMWSEAIGKKARYLKVIAKNAGPCPDWHPGKGGSTWIFADEILIETE